LDGSLEGPGSAFAAVLGGILLGATFAALEAGLAALGDVRLGAVADAGGAYAKTAARVLRDPDRIKARLLAGRVLSVSMAAAVAALLGEPLGGIGPAMGAAALVALTYAIITAVASSLATQRAGTWALRILRWLRPLELLMVPFAVPLEWLGHAVQRWVPPERGEDPERVTELGLERMIEEGREAGALADDHADLLHSVLEFKNTVAHEVMVPRTLMVGIEISKPLTEVIQLIVEKGHSRYPVYEEKVDQVAGILFAKDIFRILEEGKSFEGVQLSDLIRKKIFFVAESQKIGVLLREMQARRMHLAVVVDEFGGTAGIVTLEDIIEEIVGEIQDEYDAEQNAVLELGAGRWLVDAGISVSDLEEQIGEQIREPTGDYDSLGGMVVELAGHVPAVGESVTASGFRFTVKEADQRHVRRVELSRRDEVAAQ